MLEIENEIKELKEMSKRNFENGKYKNQEDKDRCFWFYEGEKRAYTRVLQCIREIKNEKYHDLDLDNNLPSGIFCELEFVIQELHKRFDCNIIEFWTKNNEVYY